MIRWKQKHRLVEDESHILMHPHQSDSLSVRCKSWGDWCYEVIGEKVLWM